MFFWPPNTAASSVIESAMQADRLLEVAVEVGAEVGHAALRAVHVDQRLLEAEAAEDGAERLAGLGRVDGQRLALEVEILVFLARRPEKDFCTFSGG
jgi:hypothetical protein